MQQRITSLLIAPATNSSSHNPGVSEKSDSKKKIVSSAGTPSVKQQKLNQVWVVPNSTDPKPPATIGFSNEIPHILPASETTAGLALADVDVDHASAPATSVTEAPVKPQAAEATPATDEKDASTAPAAAAAVLVSGGGEGRGKRQRRVPERWAPADGSARPAAPRAPSPAPAPAPAPPAGAPAAPAVGERPALSAPAPAAAEEFFLQPEQKRVRRAARAVTKLQQDAASAQAETARLFGGRPLHPFFTAPPPAQPAPAPAPAATAAAPQLPARRLDAPLWPVHVIPSAPAPAPALPPLVRPAHGVAVPLPAPDVAKEALPSVAAWCRQLTTLAEDELRAGASALAGARSASAAGLGDVGALAKALHTRAASCGSLAGVSESAVREQLQQLSAAWPTRGANALWAVAGAPLDGGGVAGSRAAAAGLARRLREWEAGQAALALVGPTGAGKSALLAAVCAALGLSVLEIGPALTRSGRALLQHYNEATQSASLPALLSLPPPPVEDDRAADAPSGSGSAYESGSSSDEGGGGRRARKGRPRDAAGASGGGEDGARAVLCFEEADVVMPDDRGFHGALAGLIGASKIPIVLTAESASQLLAHELARAHLHVISVRRPSLAEAVLALDVVLAAAARPLCLPLPDLCGLVRLFRHDLRRCVHQLQLVCTRAPALPLALGLAPVPPALAAQALLRPRGALRLLERVFAAVFEPASELPLLPLALAHAPLPGQQVSIPAAQLAATDPSQRQASVEEMARAALLADALSAADSLVGACERRPELHASDGPFYAIEGRDPAAAHPLGLERTQAGALAAYHVASAWQRWARETCPDDDTTARASALVAESAGGGSESSSWAECQTALGSPAWRCAGASARCELDAAVRAIARSEQLRRNSYSGRRFANYLTTSRGSSAAPLATGMLDAVTREAMRWP